LKSTIPLASEPFTASMSSRSTSSA